MLEVQLAMLGILILKSLIALIEVICIQIVCLFKTYYIPNYSASQNLNLNYEKMLKYFERYDKTIFS